MGACGGLKMFGLKKLFKKKIKKTGRVIKLWQHNTWGNSVYFNDWEKRKITGFLRNLPVIGDCIHTKMESGSTAELMIIDIKYTHNPKDMFFATVKDIGYVEV